MSKRMHCNPLTGAIGECHAQSPETCPFGAENHANSFEEIQQISDSIHQKIIDRSITCNKLDFTDSRVGITEVGDEKSQERLFARLNELNYSKHDKESELLEGVKEKVRNSKKPCNVHFITKYNFMSRRHSEIPTKLKEEEINKEWMEYQDAHDVNFGYYRDSKLNKIMHRNKKMSEVEEQKYRDARRNVEKQAWDNIVKSYKDKDLENNGFVKLRNVDGAGNCALIYIEENNSVKDKRMSEKEIGYVKDEFEMRAKNYKDVAKAVAVKLMFKDASTIKVAKKLDAYNFIATLNGRTERQKELDEAIKEAKEEEIKNMYLKGDEKTPESLEYEETIRNADLTLDNDDDDDNPVDTAELKRKAWKKYIKKCYNKKIKDKGDIEEGHNTFYYENGDYITDKYSEIIDESKQSILYVEREI